MASSRSWKTMAAVLALSSSVSFPQNAARSSGAADTITVTVTPKQTVYRQGDPMEVTVAVRNNTSNNLSIQTSPKTPPVFLRVRHKEGGYVLGVRSKPAIKINSGDPKDRTTNQTLSFGPDETKQYLVEIQSMRLKEGLTAPLPLGKYTVQGWIGRVVKEEGHYRTDLVMSEPADFAIE